MHVTGRLNDCARFRVHGHADTPHFAQLYVHYYLMHGDHADALCLSCRATGGCPWRVHRQRPAQMKERTAEWELNPAGCRPVAPDTSRNSQRGNYIVPAVKFHGVTRQGFCRMRTILVRTRAEGTSRCAIQRKGNLRALLHMLPEEIPVHVMRAVSHKAHVALL